MTVAQRSTLVPVAADSYGWLYRLAVSEEIGWKWRWRGHHPSPEEFIQRLWADVLVQYVVVDSSNATPVGLVQAYNHSVSAQHCFITALFEPRVHRQGWPLQAVETLVDRLFGEWKMRKVYAEANEVNLPSVRSGIGRLFVQEAHLRRHIQLGGDLVDSYTLAAYRHQWLANRSSRVGLAGSPLARLLEVERW